MIAVIFRPPADPVVHEVVPADRVPSRAVEGGPTVVHATCGAVGIAPVIERDMVTCATCNAVAGRHPGKKGKIVLRNQWLERVGRR